MNPADNLDNLPPDYIETLEDYPERERNRLLYGQFGEGVEGGVYSDVLLKAKDEGRIMPNVKADLRFEINAVCDLGKEDATAVWICQFLYHRTKGALVLLLDYFEETGLLVVDIVKMIQERHWVIDDIYLPHDSRNTNQTNGLSTFDVMTTIGQQQPVYKFRTHFIEKPNRIYDGINSARLLFSKCVFDEDRCAKGLEALSNYYYDFDENLGIFGKEPVKNWARHGADAFRYIALTYYEKRAPSKKPQRDPRYVYGDQLIKNFNRAQTDNGVAY
jgi:phage terminase large subunit